MVERLHPLWDSRHTACTRRGSRSSRSITGDAEGSAFAVNPVIARRCDQRFRRLIKNKSRLVPALSNSRNQRGVLPRPVQVSPVLGCLYFGAIFRPVSG